MIKISNSTKVYVYAPSKVITGGAELLHQLVHVLNTNNRESFIVYFDGGVKVPNEYSQYNIRIANEIDDNEEHIVVLYEGIFNKVLNVKKAQVLLWWLSVDNLYYNSKKFLSLGDYFNWKPVYALEIIFYRMGCLLLKKEFLFRKNISIKYLKERSNLNCYQSEYARNFLTGKGFSELLPLSDYINTDFVSHIEEETEKRENSVLYNPKKGFNYTKKLMKLAPHIKWVPLQGMSRDQLMATFRKSKLYIDFGFHPGKDRIPREAALNGCCVITGLEGSARFFEDVPILDEYKIDMKKQSAGDVLLKIEDVLKNYEAHRRHFVFYQQQILREENEFINQVKRIFNL